MTTLRRCITGKCGMLGKSGNEILQSDHQTFLGPDCDATSLVMHQQYLLQNIPQAFVVQVLDKWCMS